MGLENKGNTTQNEAVRSLGTRSKTPLPFPLSSTFTAGMSRRTRGVKHPSNSSLQKRREPDQEKEIRVAPCNIALFLIPSFS